MAPALGQRGRIGQPQVAAENQSRRADPLEVVDIVK